LRAPGPARQGSRGQQRRAMLAQAIQRPATDQVIDLLILQGHATAYAER